jgi:L-iditol 2-dehydrogenase
MSLFIASRKVAILEPLGIAIHAVGLMPPRPRDSVVILGAGPVGLLVLQVAKR